MIDEPTTGGFMVLEWQELTRLTEGRAMVVERIRLAETGVAIEGSFQLPMLARLYQAGQPVMTAFHHESFESSGGTAGIR